MKYVIVLADGMADEPIASLADQTPLEYANTECMDLLACKGEVGLVRTVPVSMKPGSDIANLSVLGYDPLVNYSGRSPLEALSIGVEMKPSDVVFRANLVTLSEDEPYREKRILDHSSGEISTNDADILMDAIRKEFNSEEFQFYTGTSYRHICVWNQGCSLDLQPPHDHLSSVIDSYIPADGKLFEMMKRSYEILNDHPLNIERSKKGLNKANSLWFWGAGTKPVLDNFQNKTGLKGAMISAVDLLKGIAVAAGMTVVRVPGVTGSIDTNYLGKANAALRALLNDCHDFAYIHIEAPDEMGHQGHLHNKIKSIEEIDQKIVSTIVSGLEQANEPFRILILPDHPTPIKYRTHTSDPVPYLLYDSSRSLDGARGYSEKIAQASGIYEQDGSKLIELLIN